MKKLEVSCFIVGGFILFDIITGILKGLSKNGLNSTILRKGLYHKLAEIVSVVLGLFLEYSCNYLNLGFNLPFFSAVSVYISVTEVVSILENLCAINPKLKKFFLPYLEKIKKGD